MAVALSEAEAAAAAGEVPVGAALVAPDGTLLARDRNRIEERHDPTAHAEILVIRAAAAKLGTPRLAGCDLYVTLEPCTMCAGALVLARIDRLVFGAEDPKAGACGSLYNLAQEPRLNHQVAIEHGVLAGECSSMLKDFFARRRAMDRK